MRWWKVVKLRGRGEGKGKQVQWEFAKTRLSNPNCNKCIFGNCRQCCHNCLRTKWYIEWPELGGEHRWQSSSWGGSSNGFYYRRRYRFLWPKWLRSYEPCFPYSSPIENAYLYGLFGPLCFATFLFDPNEKLFNVSTLRRCRHVLPTSQRWIFLAIQIFFISEHTLKHMQTTNQLDEISLAPDENSKHCWATMRRLLTYFAVLRHSLSGQCSDRCSVQSGTKLELTETCPDNAIYVKATPVDCVNELYCFIYALIASSSHSKIARHSSRWVILCISAVIVSRLCSWIGWEGC